MNLAAHLAALPPAEANGLRAVAERLRQLPEREPSADLTERILRAVNTEHSRPPFRAPKLWRVAAVLVATLALVALYLRFGVPAVRDAQADDGSCWIAAAQEADGTWQPARHGGAEAYRPALTALSALALDRADGRKYADPIGRACKALAALQNEDGAFGGNGRERYYNHAMTTFALAALASDRPGLKPVLERALAFSRASQTVEGGWDYEPGSDGNAALTSWQVRALAEMRRIGFAEAEIPLRKGLRWLRGTLREDGHVAYHRGTRNPSECLDALTAHTLITAGGAYAGLADLGRQVAGRLNPAEPEDVADCYRDYAKTLAFAAAGAAEQAARVSRQMIAHHQAGARDQWERVGGRLYTAALTRLAVGAL